MKLTCQEFEDMMFDYHYLDDAKRSAFDAHRAECDCCRDEYALVEELGEVCADMHEPPPVDFAAQVMSAVQQAEEPETGKSRAIPVLLTCLAVQIIGIGIFRHGVMRLLRSAGEIAMVVLRDWIWGFFISLFQNLSQTTDSLPTSSLPFALDWSLWVTVLAALLGFFAVTVYKASRDHA